MIFLSWENLNRNTACAKTHHWFLLFKPYPLKKKSNSMIHFCITFDTFCVFGKFFFFLFVFILVDFIFLRLTTISVLDTTPVCLCVFLL